MENMQPTHKLSKELVQKTENVKGKMLKPCRQIQLLPDIQMQSSSATSTKEYVHNETYCKEWVSKIDKVDQIDPNITLAQVDDSVENTSFGLSTLNLTSISKLPEYRSKSNEKFVSQKSKIRNTSLTKKADESPVWYVFYTHI